MQEFAKRLFASPDNERLVYEKGGRDSKPIVFPDDVYGRQTAKRAILSYNLLLHYNINQLEAMTRFVKTFPDVNWVDVYGNPAGIPPVEVNIEPMDPIAHFDPVTGKATMIRRKRVRIK